MVEQNEEDRRVADLLRQQRPSVADDGFSVAVGRRIARRRLWRWLPAVMGGCGLWVALPSIKALVVASAPHITALGSQPLSFGPIGAIFAAVLVGLVTPALLYLLEN